MDREETGGGGEDLNFEKGERSEIFEGDIGGKERSIGASDDDVVNVDE